MAGPHDSYQGASTAVRLGARLTNRPVRDHRATLALYLACLAEQLDEGR